MQLSLGKESARLALFAALVFSAATAALPTTAVAQDAAANYPNRPIRLIIPYPPGGGTDIIGRAVGVKLAEYLGQSVLIDNRPGANTIVGAEIASKASPDGYTLLFATLSTLVLNPATYKKLPYDSLRDFAPVAKLSQYAYFIVVRPGLPSKNIPELVAYAKANPGKLTYASTGDGSPAHFGGSLMESMMGIKMLHVPYKGNAQMNLDVISDRVDMTLTGLPSVEALVRAGKMRLLATGGDKRDPLFPDVPTVAEQGYKGYWMGTWFSIVTKSGTPKPIIAKLNREINRALQAPEVKKPLLDGGYELGNGTPEDLDKLIRAELPRWTKVAREAKLSFD